MALKLFSDITLNSTLNTVWIAFAVQFLNSLGSLLKLCKEASGKIAYEENWVKCLRCVVNKCFFHQLWTSDNAAEEGEGGEGGEGGQEAK